VKQREYVQHWREAHPESMEWLKNKPLRRAERRTGRLLAYEHLAAALRPLLTPSRPAGSSPEFFEAYRTELVRLVTRVAPELGFTLVESSPAEPPARE
jgi:hypothetical protein